MGRHYPKEVALRDCSSLWRWIAKHPDLHEDPKILKTLWPGWKRLDRSKWDPACPACLYAKEMRLYGIDPCRANCIIPVFSKSGACVLTESPYTRWVDAIREKDYRAAYKAAMRIAYSAEYALRKLRREESR